MRRLSNEIWPTIASLLESSSFDLDETPLDFQFDIAGSYSGGIAADLGPLGDVATASEFIQLVEDQVFDDTTFDDRIPVGVSVDSYTTRGQPPKVQIWLGTQRR